MEKIDNILASSAMLNELQNHIRATFKDKNKSAEKRALWLTACQNFHEAFDDLFFPGGYATFLKMRKNDPHAIEVAINFLVADPVHFRSGYLKEELWRRLPRWSTSDMARIAIEAAALSYLDKTIRRDFWYMCRAMSRVGSPSFWQHVAQRTDHTDSSVAKRASYLYAYKAGIDCGERLRKQIYYQIHYQKYS